MVNELVLFAVTCCTNLAEDRILGLVVNFSAALIICELDDIVMNTGRIQYQKELFDNMEPEADHETPKEGARYQILGDWKYAHCGFMTVFVPKTVSIGSNNCICLPKNCCGDPEEELTT